jgi:hypothetical protein
MWTCECVARNTYWGKKDNNKSTTFRRIRRAIVLTPGVSVSIKLWFNFFMQDSIPTKGIGWNFTHLFESVIGGHYARHHYSNMDFDGIMWPLFNLENLHFPGSCYTIKHENSWALFPTKSSFWLLDLTLTIPDFCILGTFVIDVKIESLKQATLHNIVTMSWHFFCLNLLWNVF